MERGSVRARVGPQCPGGGCHEIGIDACVQFFEHEDKRCIRDTHTREREQYPAAHSNDRRRSALVVKRMVFAQQLCQLLATGRIGSHRVDQRGKLRLRSCVRNEGVLHREFTGRTCWRNWRALCLTFADAVPFNWSTLLSNTSSLPTASLANCVSAVRLVALMSSCPTRRAVSRARTSAIRPIFSACLQGRNLPNFAQFLLIAEELLEQRGGGGVRGE